MPSQNYVAYYICFKLSKLDTFETSTFNKKLSFFHFEIHDYDKICVHFGLIAPSSEAMKFDISN